MTRQFWSRASIWIAQHTCGHRHAGAHSDAHGQRICPDCFAQVMNPLHPAAWRHEEAR